MAWQERTVEIMREEFVKRALSMEKSKAALCREYGISRPTGDKWISRFLAGEPMSNQSRAPNSSKTSLGGSGSGHCTHEAEISCFGSSEDSKDHG